MHRRTKVFTFDTSTHKNHYEVILFVTRPLNTNVNERTKVAAAEIIFGNES